MTPTQRSLAYLRKVGYRVGIAEHWNAFARIRQDLFGFIDLVAIRPDYKILAIQTTSMPNTSARIAKILELPSSADWLRAGGRIEVHGWDGPRIHIQEIIWDRDFNTLRVL